MRVILIIVGWMMIGFIYAAFTYHRQSD
uniref:Uncharacterized protein n=1 Tax=Anguilla anguilla TaxID=7936 RepID=A0A0E9V625_ANGAN